MYTNIHIYTLCRLSCSWYRAAKEKKKISPDFQKYQRGRMIQELESVCSQSTYVHARGRNSLMKIFLYSREQL